MSRTIQIAVEFKKIGLFNQMTSVIDMGDQQLHMKYEEFLYLMDAYGISIELSKFEDLKNWPGSPRIRTKPFWEAIGFKTADRLDIKDTPGVIKCDLNFPFERKEFFGKYDLVTDFGNNEHPFNVAEAYRTMHRLCKKGGYLWIDQGVINGNGYFNFDLSFFEGMAAANNYGILYSAFVVDTIDGEQYHIPCSKAILKLFDFNKINYLGVSFLFKKSTDADFKFPLQGTPNLEKPYLSYRVAYVSHRFPPERYYMPSESNFSGRFLMKELLRKIKRRFLG